jgi:hypothetical protein
VRVLSRSPRTGSVEPAPATGARGITFTLPVQPRQLLRILMTIAVTLAVVSFVLQMLRAAGVNLPADQLVRRLDVDQEAAIPAWFSSLDLFFCALLIAAIAGLRRGHQYAQAWWWLAAGIVFMSLDENVSIHEFVNDKLDGAAHSGSSGLWVVPGLVLVAIVGFLFLGFLRHLPRTYRRQFLAAAAVFLFAAAGLELLGTALDKPVPPGVDVESLRPRYVDVVENTVEEFLEMASVAFFAFSLASYIQELVQGDGEHDDDPNDREQAAA